ncbi:MAG: TIGR03986 family CRISPR-associated RAMP protein [Oscillospiraceae bacterium]
MRTDRCLCLPLACAAGKERKTMAENSMVHAPYNFVPFSNKVLVRYKNASELPAHDAICPELKTGEIQVTMTAETPVFVSNGDKLGAKNPEKNRAPHFFRGANGKFMLPGSTIRGMVRENMQILGFGLIRPEEDMEDYQIYFREMAAARESTGNQLKEYYRGALDIQTRKTDTGKTFSIPKNVCAGYLCREGGRYCIRPTQTPYLRVSRKHPDVMALGDAPARTVRIAYTASDNQVKQLVQAEKAKPGMEQGELLFTGKPVGQANHLYVFPAMDRDAAPLEISKEDILSYTIDWESRKNSLKAYYNPDFWALPEEGEAKPVFYLHHEGRSYFGMSLFLRIGYPHVLSQGLPQRHRDLLGSEDMPLDYPHSILGFARDTTSYRSRVSFGDFAAQGMPCEMEPFKIILGQPKPSYYPGYVVDGKNYAEDDFQLRGYKQYWLKDAYAVSPEKENVASILAPLPSGTKFRGTIRFKNLREDELGLLLWSLRLDEDCYQSVGMGKPYGFGRMKLSIDQLREFDLAAMYCPENIIPQFADTAEQVDDYIRKYDAFAAEKLLIKKPKKHPSLRSCNEILDFFYLHSTVRKNEEVGYMALAEYQNVRNPLPNVQGLREAQIAAETTAAPEDPYAALLAKFGAKHER